jgi:phosphate uptake regulator
VGSRSYSVSLPKEWVLANKLKPQDTVFIDSNDQKELIIRKTGVQKEASKTISKEIDSLGTLIEFIVFCYIKNIDHVILFSKNMDYRVPGIVRQALKYLEGYEITYEDEGKIEISFLFKEINITIPKIIHRIYYLLKLHVSSVERNDVKMLDEAELGVDRLYHLSTRILFSCMQDYSKRAENEIQEDEDFIFYQIITKRLEHISDNLHHLKDKKLTPSEINYLNSIMELLNQFLSKKAHFPELKEKWLNLKFTSKDPDVNSVFRKIHFQCRDVFDARISLHFNSHIQEYLVKE